jgi:hypothetical protein
LVKNDGAVSKLIQNPKFVEAVFDKIYNPLEEQARTHFEGVKTNGKPTTQGLWPMSTQRVLRCLRFTIPRPAVGSGFAPCSRLHGCRR